MQKISTLLAIGFVAITAFASCSKGSASSPTYYMKAGVDTLAYDAPNCIASNNGGSLTIFGVSGTGAKPVFPYLNIVIPGWNNSISVFNFDNTLSNSYAQYLINDTTVELSEKGSVSIYSVSNVSIKGTFYFTCTNGAVVSNGTFIAELQ